MGWGQMRRYAILRELEENRPEDDRTINNKKQLSASLRHALGDQQEFEFVEGNVPCPPAPGIAKLLESGCEKNEGLETFCFFDGASTTSILAALTDLASYIASEGPFQGVIGFSQGAALAATLMIQHSQHYLRSVHPLFRCAVFLCAGAPYDPAALGRGEAVLLDDDGSGANCGGDAVVIHVPTAHVVGEKDGALGSSMALVKLCEPRTRRVFSHAGGHDVPREGMAVAGMVAAVEDVLYLAAHSQ